MRLTIDTQGPIARLLLPFARYYVPVLLIGVGVAIAVDRDVPWVWLALVPLAVVTAFAADNVLAGRVREMYPRWHQRWRFWILPVGLVLATTLFLHLIADQLIFVGVPIMLVLLIGSLWAEGRVTGYEASNLTIPNLVLSITAYVTIFLLYSAVYDAPVGATGQAAAIGAFSFVMALEIFRQGNAGLRQAFPHAVVVALLLGQVAFALDYWPLAGMAGGIFLLLVFYALTGIGQSYFAGRLSRNTVLEFLGIMVAGFILLFVARTWIT